MRVRVCEAKDFLVQQTAEQALLEAVTLSGLEKRMMYFTENDDISEDATKLNDEFNAQYDTSAYESKISGLLHRAYARVERENPEAARLWIEAIGVLRKGDHYILVLWGQSPPTKRPPYDFLKLLGTSLVVTVAGVALMFGVFALLDHYGIHWKTRPETHRLMPVWGQRLLVALMAGGYAYYVILPWILKMARSRNR